jgi:two-component system response regulator AtoC
MQEHQTKSILVIDTDPGVRWSLEKGLAHSGFMVQTATTAEEAVRLAQETRFAAILMEIMPEAGFSVDVLSSLVQAPGAPCVLCASIDAAPHVVIECMRRGAVGFLPKPFGLAGVRAELAKALSERPRGARKAGDREAEALYEPSLLIGVSPPVQELRATIKQVAQTDLNCLVRGESGVGKDLVAREIHRLSRRRDQPFIKVNSGALPEQLLESELFGYEKGAFTGAMASKPGRFSLANKGIIFLDEICEVPLNVQAKLLQVIEHKEFTRLGGRHSLKVDVQIVVATNADIEQRLHAGAFRQDLYFRLNEVCIWVPLLRDRREDIPLLVRHFIHKYAHLTRGTPVELSGEDIAVLCEQDWPGNVRELENVTKRWLALRTRDLKSLFGGSHSALPGSRSNPSLPAKANDADDPEPELILRTLEKYQWHRQKAAQALNMSYQALRRRIIKYKLDQAR